jgi:hypothetical protein
LTTRVLSEWWSGGVAAGQLDGLGRVDDRDPGPRPDLGPPLEHVVVVAGDEGVVAGYEMGGEVLDVRDLAAAGRGGLGPEEDLPERGVGGGVLVGEEPVRAVQGGVVEPEWPGDAADERLPAQPFQVSLVLVGRVRSWSTANASVMEMPTRPWATSSASSSSCGPYGWAWAAWMTLLVSRVSRSMAVSMPGPP